MKTKIHLNTKPIIDFMKKENLSAAALAEKCKISAKTLHNILNGTHIPRLNTFLRIYNVTKISLDKLLNNEKSGR